MNCLPKIDQKVIFRFAEVGLNTIIVSDKKKARGELEISTCKEHAKWHEIKCFIYCFNI
jgi:hypothetical protein